MNDDTPETAGVRPLEFLAATTLWLVMAALAWMLAAAYWPAMPRLSSVEAEVIAVLTLLIAALGLVSVVALLHTRK